MAQQDNLATEIVALAQKVGLKGFMVADAPSASAADEPVGEEQTEDLTTDSTAAEIVALAKAVGLKGFA